MNTQAPIDWTKLANENSKLDAKGILAYSINELCKSGEVVFLTAFGPEGCVIMKLIHDLHSSGELDKTLFAQNFSIANLDTGYQFKETLELKSRLEAKYGFPINMVKPALTVAEQDAKHGKDLYKSDPDQCCYMRKLVPLNVLLNGRLAWISSIRSDQTEHRAKAQIFEYDNKFKLGKINPLLAWTKSDIWKEIHEHKIPYNPLLDQDYESIGCEPCTSTGADRKASRWAGKDKIECGLHIQDDETGGEFNI